MEEEAGACDGRKCQCDKDCDPIVKKNGEKKACREGMQYGEQTPRVKEIVEFCDTMCHTVGETCTAGQSDKK